MNQRYYLLKAQLLDIEPAIWRRFVIPDNITLDRLHDVIQIVMGWTDSHLHDFEIGTKRYTEYPESKEDGYACGKYSLGNLIKLNGRKILYSYDFGDNWEHEITLEDSHFSDPELEVPLFCLDGKRACPPEDVGGAQGYIEFCNAMKDPKHEEHDHYTAWFGGKFDSEQFDPDLINSDLMKYLRWGRNRHQNWYLLD